jgi:hypothetical protein
MAVRNRARRPDSERCHRCGARSARRTDANWTMTSVCRERALGERRTGRRRQTNQPSSRTGENLPYGMIERIEEMSASFEARSVSYPTKELRGSRFIGSHAPPGMVDHEAHFIAGRHRSPPARSAFATIQPDRSPDPMQSAMTSFTSLTLRQRLGLFQIEACQTPP